MKEVNSQSKQDCPICGENNHCQIIQGADSCWCMEADYKPGGDINTSIDASIGPVCLCSNCLSKLKR